MGYTQVGGSDAYIPAFDGESTANLIFEYSRNPKSWKLNQFSELRPVTQDRGNFCLIEPEQAARVIYDDGREFAWPPGADRPTGTDNQERFQFSPYHTQRRAHSVPLDNRAIEMSAWPVAQVELRAKMHQLMTARTRLAIKRLNTAFTGSPQTSTVAAITGSTNTWDKGTPLLPYIKIALQYVEIAINQATLGVVNPEDLVMVISPDTATAMSQSAEIQGLLSNSVYAYPLLTGTLPGMTERNWSLPPMLYNTRIAVENTVVVTSLRGAATVTRQYAVSKGTVFILTRKENELVNPTILEVEKGNLKMTDREMQAVPVNSTLVGFFKEEATTENFSDPKNRKTEISIATDYDFITCQPLSGFMLTSAITGT
jgi:hypothetical protein